MSQQKVGTCLHYAQLAVPSHIHVHVQQCENSISSVSSGWAKRGRQTMNSAHLVTVQHLQRQGGLGRAAQQGPCGPRLRSERLQCRRARLPGLKQSPPPLYALRSATACSIDGRPGGQFAKSALHKVQLMRLATSASPRRSHGYSAPSMQMAKPEFSYESFSSTARQEYQLDARQGIW